MRESFARHQLIMASAGSGKTYQLTHRYCALLAHGVAPERIIALTFTRMAAGEFLREILRKLAHAAIEPEYAAELGKDFGLPGLDCTAFRGLLRTLLRAMPRLMLTTLDGFFATVLRQFPMEFGLSGDFEMLDEHAVEVSRQRLLGEVFTLENATAREAFIEAFEQATWGQEMARMYRTLDSFLSEQHALIQEAPQAVQWASPEQIWAESFPWNVDKAAYAEAVTCYTRYARAVEAPPKTAAEIETILAELEIWRPGEMTGEQHKQFLKNMRKHEALIQAGTGEITLRRRSKLSLTPDLAQAMQTMRRAFVGTELARALKITQGVHRIVDTYERLYHERVRSRGRLTFHDVLSLISGMVSENAPTLSQRITDDDALWVQYRLDARYEHWLLDEFQDTSYPQMRVLEPLIDEVMQDISGERTFFCVGDVKQSIYGWRKGDPALMQGLRQRYAGMLEEAFMTDSRRSSPEVLTVVNRLFGDFAGLHRFLGERAVKTWERDWREHHAHPSRPPGYASVASTADGQVAESEVLAVLERIRPWERDLECALLLRSNEQVRQWVNRLRGRGIPVASGSDEQVGLDNLFGLGFAALLKQAFYPGDTLAAAYVMMTPFGKWYEQRNIPASQRRKDIQASLHGKGFAGTVRLWHERLIGMGVMDAFARARARSLEEAAQRFDEADGADVDVFIAYLEKYRLTDVAGAGTVRVMTIHRSKGLGFDMVIIPEMETRTQFEPGGNDMLVRRNAERGVDWVMRMPPKDFAREDAALSACMDEVTSEREYESLCLWYVALTRAKHALYLFSEEVAATNRSFCAHTRACFFSEEESEDPKALASHGNPNWFASLSAVADSSTEQPIYLPLEGSQHRPRLRRVQPSEGDEVRTTSLPLKLNARQGLRFGLEVHNALSCLDWWRGDWAETMKQMGLSPETDNALSSYLKQAFHTPAFQAVFIEPSKPYTLWREQAFEVVMGDEWVSGVFDRVLITGSPDAPSHACLYDFKTDRNSTESEAVSRRHAGQMRLYARALCEMLSLPKERVTVSLVLLESAQVIQMKY